MIAIERKKEYSKMMNNKILMVLTNAFAPDVRVEKEALYLNQLGYDLTIFALDKRGEFLEKAEEVNDKFKIKRIYTRNSYHEVLINKYKVASKAKKLFYLFWYFSFIKRLSHFLSVKKYDFLHCHDLEGIIAGYIARRGKNIPIIFDMHEYYEMQSKTNVIKRWIIRTMVNFFQNKSSHIIYVHEIQKSNVKSRNLEKFIYLPNYIDPQSFKDVVHDFSPKLRINFIGSVNNHIKLFKNWFLACKDIEGLEINIYGDGPGYEMVKEIAKSFFNVSVKGRYDARNEQHVIYSKTDISYIIYDYKYSQPVIWNQPNKFFEAIFTCTPIIVQEGTYMGDFSQHYKTGFTVDTYNINSIRNCIKFLKDNPKEIENARENIKEIQDNFCWENVSRNLWNAYPPISY